MPTTLATLAELVQGTLVGDGDTPISGANPQRVATPGEITLIDSSEKAQRFGAGQAAAAVCPRGFTLAGVPVVQVDDVHAAFTKIVSYFRPARAAAKSGIDPRAIVSSTARLAANVTVHAGATIGDDCEIGSGCVIHSGVQIMAGCRLAENVTLFPNVVLYENTRIGARCIVHGGAVLGAYGFGYKLVDGQHVLSAQLGYVELHDDVEVGASTTIDRGTYGPTLIGAGTKIDNQVMIAHNCRLGRGNLICSQVGIAGSTSTGDYVVMAGQVGVRDHVHIGDQAVLGAKAGVSNDVGPGIRMLGTPATVERDQKLMMATYAKLPELRHQIKHLEAAVHALEKLHQEPGQAAA
ncbi:MAG: UDP-3-O-(3-hydroxymyristoyl)glucosamine N-acyltransferase [Planctomycetes bacterium]|nr:UDP-3-O-(3-hydroxymyristoyl)glucosamine N-acyltransferase [Planctomycetota bacterium]